MTDAAGAGKLRAALVGAGIKTDRLDNLKTMRLMESVYTAAGVEVRP